MAGFGMILGGAAKGLGAGLLAQAQAKREETLRLLENERQDKLLKEERDFRSSEADKARKFESEQSQLNRDASGVQYGTEAGSGFSVAIRGDKATPVTGPDGQPMKLSTKGDGSDDPADVKTAEWLIQQGVAKDADEAWSLVRRARENPENVRASIFKQWMTTLKPEFGKADGDEIQREAARLTDETMKVIDGGGDAG